MTQRVEIPSTADSGRWYEQGIRQAEQNGLIHYAQAGSGRRPAIQDHYSHICHGDGAPLLLKYTNTRPLSLIARQILGLYANDADVRILELGPGAGVACSTVHRLLPDAAIDIVSLTPLNPYLSFLADDVYHDIAEQVSPEECPSFYHPCRRPFVRHQYIGRFPQEIAPPKDNYHFIYDNYGAIFCGLRPDGSEDTLLLARTLISSALSLLRADGTLLILASEGAHRMEDALESMTGDGCVIMTCKRVATYHSLPCVVAKRDSPLAVRLRGSEGGWSSGSARMVRLEAGVLQDLISRICVVA
jgi:hypothetical protein